jgi:predicted amidohydrolase
MSAGSTFTAAMVQMRTGLLPEPSLEQGTRLIREAAAQGADYVLTPEVSNMMQLNRKALFEHLASEEDDLSLKAYRALAAELKIHLHIGSLALRLSRVRQLPAGRDRRDLGSAVGPHRADDLLRRAFPRALSRIG